MAKQKSPYDLIDISWLTILGLVGAVLCGFLSETVFDASIFFSGILCVGLIAIGRREGYLFGLYNSISYAILAYTNGLFGEVYLNILFFLPTGVIGYLMWVRHPSDNHAVQMRSLSGKDRTVIAVLCILSMFGLGKLLALNPGQNTPYVDASTNVLSILATFLMMWRYKEQWLLYILLNLLSVIMWFLRFQAGGNSGDLMVLMWSLFLVNAIFGYWRWNVGANADSPPVAAYKEPVCAVD